MLIIRSLSASTALQVHEDELHQIFQSNRPIRALKNHLAQQLGVPRFRQRLFTENGEVLEEWPLECNSLLLLKLGFQQGDVERNQVFVSACGEGRLTDVENTLCLPHNPDTLDPASNRTRLCAAAENGHLELVRLLIEAGADKDAVAERNRTALHFASCGGCPEIVRELLTVGADKNAVASHNATALHMASYNGHLEVGQELLQARADTHVASLGGNTALHLASLEGHVKVAESLLTAGADRHAVTWLNGNLNGNFHGATALCFAAFRGYLEVVRLLLEAGVDKDAAMTNGSTPIYIAAQNGYLEVVRLLLEAGADKDAATALGETRTLPPSTATWKLRDCCSRLELTRMQQ